MLLQEFLENTSKRLPRKTALIAGSARLTWGEIEEGANRLARSLAGAGVGYGDRVVVLLDNSPETVISVFGILKADAVFVVLNPSIKAEKLAYILDNCRATALITHSGKWDMAEGPAAAAGALKTVVIAGNPPDEHPPTGQNAHTLALLPWDDAAGSGDSSIPPRRAIDIDLASLIYTSGTTGNPKGVMLTHGNMVSASTSITTYLENVEDDIILSVLPLSFDYGLYQAIMAAQFGGTLVLEKSFLYPYAVINLMKKERVTGLPIVPTISAILLQLEKLREERFPHLRYITNTAAALPVSHILGLQEIFPGTAIYSMYGLTECKRVSYLPPSELETRPTSVGRGMPNEQVYLVDEHDNVITEPDTPGELIVRGANVMKGYWELPAETDRMLRPGPHPWEKVLYSGDLFTMDNEGYLYFLSRKDDIIKSRGEKVSPKEVESVLYEMPDVVEAAVVGIEDDILGEAVKAFVVLKKGSAATDKEVIAWCMRRLEDFMVPKTVEFRDSLPKTSSGKITKKGL
jgi:acyl-CoA synthetase (AMP-forming)/AMP-acid ligase II